MPRQRKSIVKRHEIQTAERERTCKHSGAKIKKGQACLVVWDSQYDRSSYSREVGLLMIEDARKALDLLLVELGDGSV